MLKILQLSRSLVLSDCSVLIIMEQFLRNESYLCYDMFCPVDQWQSASYAGGAVLDSRLWHNISIPAEHVSTHRGGCNNQFNWIPTSGWSNHIQSISILQFNYYHDLNSKSAMIIVQLPCKNDIIWLILIAFEFRNILLCFDASDSFNEFGCISQEGKYPTIYIEQVCLVFTYLLCYFDINFLCVYIAQYNACTNKMQSIFRYIYSLLCT